MQENLRTPAVANAKPANRERLVMPPVPIVKIAMLVNTVKAKKTTVSTPLIQRLVLVALLVGRPKPVVLNVNLAKQELSVMLRVKTVKIAMLANTVQAKKTTVLTPLTQRLVLIAQRGIHQALVVPSAKPVVRGHTAMGVSLVPKVNTATAVILLRSPADIAQPVTTVTTLVKVLVCPAFL